MVMNSVKIILIFQGDTYIRFFCISTKIPRLVFFRFFEHFSNLFSLKLSENRNNNVLSGEVFF